MTLEEFVQYGGEVQRGALRALWLARQGKWDQAHDVAQAEDSRDGSWVHAYLHRVEGDTANAIYWYRRAGRPAQHGDLDTEWKTIVVKLLQETGT